EKNLSINKESVQGSRRPAPLMRGAGTRSAQRPAFEPGMARQALGLEGADLVGMAQRQPDVVKAVQQAILAKRLDIEMHGAAFRRAHDLLVEIDTQFVARESPDFVEQARHFELGQ